MIDKPIAITCGDPAGVGPEIVAKIFKEHPELREKVCPVGPASWLSTLDYAQAKEVGEPGFRADPGKPSVEGAVVALEALDEAAYGCRQGRYSAVVTGPVSKAWMSQAGGTWPGQTEFFAERWYGEPTMAFAGGKLTVVLATWHVPLMEVMNHLTRESVERAVKNADRLARKLGASTPRIGVCGLNPHAGEGGLIGYEEQGQLDPMLDVLRETYPGLSKCEPGDTLFHRQLQGEFDVIIAMYHDQGLAPLKAVDFDRAVNITLGLPFVRTSPDHGTAFGIAGQGKADAGSFLRAIELAGVLM
ncbi:4-hydroxythreonine-4-phosphate dehydrogenase PdxA [Ruficoccus amylovorans]|uniref:4-hydroxythreonine-4-phosphate dehydrogenase PdxA n=1 Tax=Ruficoccus amylovorans TaxID=1804625 RepID=A0A842HJ92_9BACT|nr:4-hydroxythreonine-4-phosphate dehydrogenase PdxA [Ruficoccus amylovorans]MBC2596459.1 4-hydroxythreonine-4-phosphate dehydrogenase PdxA [Ruficoccus amylovorans]